MTLNRVMGLTLRYLTEFGNPAFQRITASMRIKLIDQKLASVTDRAVKSACVTKCKDFSVTYFKFIAQVSLYRCSFLRIASSCGEDRRLVAEFIVL